MSTITEISELTYDSEGYIFYKENQVEHYSPYHFNSMEEMIADHNYGYKLLQHCRHLENLGVVPNSSNCAWRADWFKDITHANDPFLFFADNYNDLYIKNDLVIMVTGHSPILDGEKTFTTKWIEHFKIINLSTREIKTGQIKVENGFHHYIHAKGYTSLKAIGQNSQLGGIYGTLEQWKITLQKLKIPLYFFDTEENLFFEFSLQSMKTGFEIEVTEDTYYHFLNCVPPLRLKYKHNQHFYFLNSEPITYNKEGIPSFYAFRADGNQFFGRTISPDRKSLKHSL